jgi:endothelin-converting enzyme/putative endopeptidase
VPITRASYWDDVLAGRRFNVRDNLATIGKPVDRGRWGLTPPTSDAYYNPLLNEIVFPAGILQPPAFSLTANDAVNYGAIGVVIGHEISHGFDDQGAQYDAQGRLQNWWSEDDLKKFQDKTACVVRQFDGYEAAPGVHHQGKLVAASRSATSPVRASPIAPSRFRRRASRRCPTSTASRRTSSSSSRGASSAATP